MDLLDFSENSNAAGPTAEKSQPEDTSQKKSIALESKEATDYESKRISCVEVSLEDTKTLVQISYQSRSAKSTEEEKKEEEAVKDRDDLEVQRDNDASKIHDRALPLGFEWEMPDDQVEEMATREVLDSTSGGLQEKGEPTSEKLHQEVPNEVADLSLQPSVVAELKETLDVLSTSVQSDSVPDATLTETEEVTLETKPSQLDQKKEDVANDPYPVESKVDDQSTYAQDSPEAFVVEPLAKPTEKILDLAPVEHAKEGGLKSETPVLDQLLASSDEKADEDDFVTEENQHDQSANSDEKTYEEEVVTEENQHDQSANSDEKTDEEEVETEENQHDQSANSDEVVTEENQHDQSANSEEKADEEEVVTEEVQHDQSANSDEKADEEEVVTEEESPQDSLPQAENEVALEEPSAEPKDEPVEEELETEHFKENEQMQEPVVDDANKDHNQTKDGKDGISNSSEGPTNVQEIPLEVQAPVQDVLCLAQESAVPEVHVQFEAEFPEDEAADEQTEEANNTKTETNLAVNEVHEEPDEEITENQVDMGGKVLDFDEIHNENLSILSDASTVLVANQSTWEYSAMDMKSSKPSTKVWSTFMRAWSFCAILIALAGIGISVSSSSPAAMDGLCAPVGFHKNLEFDELVSAGETSISFDAPWWAPEAMKPWAFSALCGDDRERIQLTLSKTNARKKFFQLSLSALSKNDNDIIDGLTSYKGLSMASVDSKSITYVSGRSKRKSTVSAPWSQSFGVTE